MEPKLTIELTATEIQNLGVLLDAAVKATGIQGGKIAVPIIEKLEAAVAAHNAANAPKEEKEAA
jgi:hypothetical protein